MIIYWIVTIFSNDFTKTNLQIISLGQQKKNLYVEKIKDYSEEKLLNLNFLKNLGLRLSSINIVFYGIILSNFLLGLLLIIRWIDSGHFPLSNLYESLMFLSWCFTTIHIILEKFIIYMFDKQINNKTYTIRQNPDVVLNPEDLKQTVPLGYNKYVKLLGAITTPSALFTNAFATFTLPKEMQETSPLVPALQSNWLMMHVTVMIISYAALILGSLISIAYLVYTYNFIPNTFTPFGHPVTNNLLPQKDDKTENSIYKMDYKPEAKQFAIILDSLSYRILGIGFPFLTIGILSGAVWANEAWGSYWSWDPKETWALLTWLIFAIYLHTRFNKGWQGKKPAIIASLGFIIVWICYLGVNLIGEGLHSYGWISGITLK